MIVQTFNPDHYAIQAAARHDYKGFYPGEIRFRAEHGYPPYGQLARLVYSRPATSAASRPPGPWRDICGSGPDLGSAGAGSGVIDVLGPTPCFVHKVRGRYRWQVLVRGDALAPLLEDFAPGPGWALDVDPMSVL